jgi:hypothetical protein
MGHHKGPKSVTDNARLRFKFVEHPVRFLIKFATRVKGSPMAVRALRSAVMQILCVVLITVGEGFQNVHRTVRFGTLFDCAALLP